MKASKKAALGTGELSATLREVVFGIEDGMVSTLGAVSGIAIGSQDRFTILLAGFVIIAVESISMGIGSFLSNSTSKEVDDKAIAQEKRDIKLFPEKEKQELYDLFIRDGWTKRMAYQMTMVAALDKKLMFKEHEYRELGIFPYGKDTPIKNAIFMFISYISGGLIPLSAYLFLPLGSAMSISLLITLVGLFVLGAVTTRFTNTHPLKAGIRTLILGGIAFSVGGLIGKLATFIQ